jgi:hypothetical protein
VKRIDERTVELTDAEQAASDEFDRMLDQGYGIDGAIDVLRFVHSGLSEEFWAWLR